MEVVAFAGMLTEASSDVVASLVASTGLTGAAARYAAVLAEWGEGEVESATAIGFFSGLGFGVSALLLEALV